MHEVMYMRQNNPEEKKKSEAVWVRRVLFIFESSSDASNKYLSSRLCACSLVYRLAEYGTISARERKINQASVDCSVTVEGTRRVVLYKLVAWCRAHNAFARMVVLGRGQDKERQINRLE